MTNNLGFSATIDTEIRMDAILFGESQGRIIVTCTADHIDAIKSLAMANNIDCQEIGSVTSGNLDFNGESFGAIGDYKESYMTSLAQKLN